MSVTPRRPAGRLSLDLQSVTKTGAALSLSRADTAGKEQHRIDIVGFPFFTREDRHTARWDVDVHINVVRYRFGGYRSTTSCVTMPSPTTTRTGKSSEIDLVTGTEGLPCPDTDNWDRTPDETHDALNVALPILQRGDVGAPLWIVIGACRQACLAASGC